MGIIFTLDQNFLNSKCLSSYKSTQIMAKIIIKAMKDGPCVVTVDGQKIVALCRCGASNNKPRCDGTHAKIGFKADESQIEA